MTRILILTFVAAVAVCAGAAHVLTRIDTARADAKRATVYVDAMDAELRTLAQMANVLAADHAKQRDDLALCRRRTENLRDVIAVLIQSGTQWPSRVGFPHVAGWEPWPSIKGHGEMDAR